MRIGARYRIGVLSLLAGAIVAALENGRAALQLRSAAAPMPPEVCAVARYERWNGATVIGESAQREVMRRFAGVPRQLPPLTRLGFASELPPTAASVAGIERFELARLAVVPVMLDTQTSDLVLGDFPHVPRRDVERQWSVVRDFGRGVYLLRPR